MPASIREEGQEEFVPTPGAMPHAMDEEQRRFVRLRFWNTSDGFEFHGRIKRKSAPLGIFTCLKPSSSIACRVSEFVSLGANTK